VLTLKGNTAVLTDIAYSPDGTLIVTSSRDSALRVWNASTGALIATLKGPTADLTSVAFNPNGTQIAAGSSNNIIWLWELPKTP